MILLLASMSESHVHAAIEGGWSTVAIGGGGYVTGLVQSAATGAAYARTDVGGAWRLPSARNGSWTQLLTSFPPRLRNFYAVESIAVEGAALYLAVGDGFRLPSAILRSEDGGATWINRSATEYVVPIAGNGASRWCGERLAIVPSTSARVAFFASRTHGVLRRDGSPAPAGGGGDDAKWVPVQSLPPLPDPGYTFLLFANETLAFLGAAGVGVYRSTDAGANWTLLGGGPTMPCRAAWSAKQQALFVTSNTTVSALRNMPSSWSDITPPTRDAAWSGIALHPRSGALYVSAHSTERGSMPYHNPIYEAYAASLLREEMPRALAGTWVLINNASSVAYEADVPWWGAQNNSQKFCSAVSALMVMGPDAAPAATTPATAETQLLVGTWYGVWRSSANRSALPPSPSPPSRSPWSSWTTHERGHEEVVTLALAAPAAGDALLFSGVADVEGFRHVDLDAYPAQRLSSGRSAYLPTQSTTGLAVCAANASFVARVHGDEPYDERIHGIDAIGALSRDNGVTWAPFGGGVNATGGYIHFVGDLTCAQLLYLPFGATAVPLVSKDWGVVWTPSVGAPRGVSGGATQWEGCECHRVECEAAPRDGGAPGLCYSYAPLTAAAGRGVVSISINGGAAWSNSSAALPLPSAGVPGYLGVNYFARGELCVCLGTAGLWCSHDSAQSFARDAEWLSCTMLDWGVADSEADVNAVGGASPNASSGSAAATLYVLGQRAVPPNVDADAHLYARVGVGVGGSGSPRAATWVRANPPSFALGEAVHGPLVASKRRWGEVFIAADGQGIYRGELGPMLRDAAARGANDRSTSTSCAAATWLNSTCLLSKAGHYRSFHCTDPSECCSACASDGPWKCGSWTLKGSQCALRSAAGDSQHSGDCTSGKTGSTPPPSPGPPPGPGPGPSPGPTPSGGTGKRGGAVGNKLFLPGDLDLLPLPWWYAWHYNNQSSRTGAEFVPMVWGRNDIAKVKLDQVPSYEDGSRFLLGFNEPNIRTQSNITAAEACAIWPTVDAAAKQKNLSLGSPGVNHCHFEPAGHCFADPLQWLSDFFACLPQASAKNVAFIHAHYYGCNASAVLEFVHELHTQFGGRPVWLTEFACSYHDEASNLAYMKELLPQLDALPASELARYSWYASRTDQTAGPGHGRNANTTLLFPGTSARTSLGEYYMMQQHTVPRN